MDRPTPLSSQTLDMLEYSSDFVSGYIGGVAGIVVGHPFDTVKVQQQISRGQFPSILQCSTDIMREEGIRGFYRGMAFPVLAVGFLNSVFFGVYGNTKRVLNSVRGRQTNAEASLLDVFVAGAVGGGIQGIPATPIELVKVKLQAQRLEIEALRQAGKQAPSCAQTSCASCSKGTCASSALSNKLRQTSPANFSTPRYRGPFDCVGQIYRAEGLRGCFRGLNATILREVPGFSSYMLSYEYMVRKVTPENTDPSVRTMFFAGGIAGMISWVVNIPVDVIKTRLQTDPSFTGFWDCFIKSFQKEGLPVFFRGLPAMCMRAFPTNAVTLTVYPILLKLFNDSINKRRSNLD